MPKVFFSGEILPLAYPLSLDSSPSVRWEDIASIGLTAEIKLTIAQNKFRIEVDLNRDISEIEIVHIYTRSYDMVRASVDLLNFATGRGFQVVVREFTNAAGETTEFTVENPALARSCTSYQIDKPIFGSVLQFALTNHNFNWALRDLIEANTLPHHSTINCGRVIEALRRLVANEPPGADVKLRAKAWVTFQTTLNIDESYVKYITEQSTPGRHGDRSHVPGKVTMDIVQRTWQIMDRFIHFKLGGDKPLDTSRFPLLV